MAREISNAGGFGDLLRRILIHEKQQPPAKIAAALGLPLGALHAKMNGRARFSPDELAILFREISDERLVKWLFARSGLRLVSHPVAKEPAPGTTLFQHALAGVAATAGALLELIDGLEQPSRDGQPPAGTRPCIDAATAELLWIRQCFAAAYLVDDPSARQNSDRGFGPLVRQILLTEKGISLASLAASLELSAESFYARITGRVPFDPVELRTLFRLHPEPRLADCLLVGTPCVALSPTAGEDSEWEYGPLRAGLESLRTVIKLLMFLRISDRLEPAGSSGRSWPIMDCASPATEAAILIRSLNDALRALAAMQGSTSGRNGRLPAGPQPRKRLFAPYNPNGLPFERVAPPGG